MSYDKNVFNKVVSGTLAFNVRDLPSKAGKALFKAGLQPDKTIKPAGRATGQVIDATGGKWYQVTLYKDVDGKATGYVL